MSITIAINMTMTITMTIAIAITIKMSITTAKMTMVATVVTTKSSRDKATIETRMTTIIAIKMTGIPTDLCLGSTSARLLCGIAQLFGVWCLSFVAIVIVGCCLLLLGFF